MFLYLKEFTLISQSSYEQLQNQLRPGRSSRRRCSVKKRVLRNFAKFTGKRLCQSLFFNKFATLSPATLLKMRLWLRCFPSEFCKISRDTFSYRAPLVAGPEIHEKWTSSGLFFRYFSKTFQDKFSVECQCTTIFDAPTIINES